MERDEGREKERERERKQEGANSNELVRTRKKSVLLRALGAQPRSRKPAFVTHDNEASLYVRFTVFTSKIYGKLFYKLTLMS